ncbi:hypothetical protein JI735_10530 [Paenibacillus sonchi]|uniref:Uncharacterized protein n=1 Tax=Paenibacillus sonchi TaxID=373687 RepID=A0A974PFB4_9BACL|nr:hypothetical protein JI735_10530 [Paenibacillus sonchi]
MFHARRLATEPTTALLPLFHALQLAAELTTAFLPLFHARRPAGGGAIPFARLRLKSPLH